VNYGDLIKEFEKNKKTRAKKQGVCHIVGLSLTSIFKEKEELWKLKYFIIQKYNLLKILQKKPKPFKIL